MNQSLMNERLFEVLINGDRAGARALVNEIRGAGHSANTLLSDLFWPTYEMIEKLFRNDQLTMLSHRLATRLLRVLVDQVAASLEFAPPNSRSIFAWCGPSDADELGAQMAVDLLEAEGYLVTFSGGGIAGDEVLALVQDSKPDILLMFCSAPGDLPQIRGLIDTIREIGACPNLQMVVGGGVFNRADGLAEEIGADLWAVSPMDLVARITAHPAQRAAREAKKTVATRRSRNKAA